MDVPSVSQMRAAAQTLAPHVMATAIQSWQCVELEARLGAQSPLVLKLELFQRTGTFKFRAAMLNVLGLTEEQRRHGVTAVSAGNHAIAVACAAQRAGVSAKVVMLATASPMRIAAARAYGAEVIISTDGRTAFALAEDIRATEGRAFIHPFDGRNVVLGTSGVGMEFLHQAPELDAIVVAIGGGGLMAGVAAAVKQLKPSCRVYGVEPIGADVMSRSFRAAAPQRMEHIDTIVSDDAMCAALALLYREAKLAVEPAGAAATAAVLGPLAARLRGARTGVVVCGSNIDSDSFHRYLKWGERQLQSQASALSSAL